MKGRVTIYCIGVSICLCSFVVFVAEDKFKYTNIERIGRTLCLSTGTFDYLTLKRQNKNVSMTKYLSMAVLNNSRLNDYPEYISRRKGLINKDPFQDFPFNYVKVKGYRHSQGQAVLDVDKYKCGRGTRQSCHRREAKYFHL